MEKFWEGIDTEPPKKPPPPRPSTISDEGDASPALQAIGIAMARVLERDGGSVSVVVVPNAKASDVSRFLRELADKFDDDDRVRLLSVEQ